MSIGSFLFNFNNFLMGNPATAENFYVSVLFILTWAGFTLFSRKSYKMLTYILVYWALVFIASCLGCIVLSFDSNLGILHDIALMLGILFWPQMYGLTYLLPQGIITLLVQLPIALAFIVYCNWYKNHRPQ